MKPQYLAVGVLLAYGFSACIIGLSMRLMQHSKQRKNVRCGSKARSGFQHFYIASAKYPIWGHRLVRSSDNLRRRI